MRSAAEKRRRTPDVISALLLSVPLLAAPAPEADRYWPQWRGPHATGVSSSATPPAEWSETKNVRWKVEIPGRGSGTPVIWGDRVFVLTAVPAGATGAASHAPQGAARTTHKFMVLALDRKTGKVIWDRVAKEEVPHEAAHPQNGTWASSSAITDGERVYAYFESRGLFAYDMNGTLLWQKDLGHKSMRMQFGEGATPALHGRYLVVVWDHQGQSFIAAFDKTNGEELWRKTRDEIDTWATPLIVEVNGRAQVVTPAMRHIRSYDLATGDVVWETTGLTMNPIPSPVVDNGVAVLMSGFQGNALKAIRLADAKGDVTNSGAVLWTYNRDTPYVPSPLLYEHILYFLKSNNGILSVLDAATGAPHYQLQRLDALTEVFSSPVGAAGRVYIAGRNGKTMVLKHGTTYQVLAVNALDDGFDASPALVDKELYLRGYSFLYCIADDKVAGLKGL
jgi:outer membrane protein assembly factor BamB